MTRLALGAIAAVGTFGLLSSTGALQAASGSPQTRQQQAALTDADFLEGVYLPETEGVVAPVRDRTVEPRYTVDAMRQKIQGTVQVQVVVMPDGTVARARVVESLDAVYGLDEEARLAALRWTFEPGTGTLNGRPVPVAVTIPLDFRLHD